eukprot:Clim_evm6s134 gene=Clim_evmTU6s134
MNYVNTGKRMNAGFGGVQGNQTALHYAEEGVPEGTKSLEQERANATFDPKKMTTLLDGGAKKTKIRKEVQKIFEENKELHYYSKADMTVTEKREASIKTIKALREAVPPMPDYIEASTRILALYSPGTMTRIGVHFGLFGATVINQGDEEQVDQWQQDILTVNRFGCFAMTELGWGSNVQGQNTTATYDSKTQEFVIHTPSLKATKWWIGGAAHTALYCVCFARLLTQGQDYGMHPFIVPLRSEDTGDLLPGIFIGDCGAKMGRDEIDNGWIQFNQVRIPRTNMLMKWSQVKEDGTYVPPPKKELAYGALTGGRVEITLQSALTMQAALTIAVRYSCVRRQFKEEDGDAQEMKIMDYQTHQRKLMPLLAQAYGYHFAGMRLRELEREVQEDIRERRDVSRVADLHAASAGLKAFSTWNTLTAIETCRQCLGGHGYSKYTVLSDLYADHAVNCTWEGDNTVLTLQSARYLLSTMAKARAGEQVSGYASYLATAAKGEGKLAGKKIDLRDPAIQARILQHRVATLVQSVEKDIAMDQKAGMSAKAAWNANNEDLLGCARAHNDFVVYRAFDEFIQSRKAKTDAAVIAQLIDLRDMFFLTLICENSGQLLTDGFVDGEQMAEAHELFRAHSRHVRQNAVPLVDSFDFEDWMIRSPFGRYDGNIYEYYFQRVNEAPGATGKAPYYDSLVAPMLSKL